MASKNKDKAVANFFARNHLYDANRIALCEIITDKNQEDSKPEPQDIFDPLLSTSSELDASKVPSPILEIEPTLAPMTNREPIDKLSADTETDSKLETNRQQEKVPENLRQTQDKPETNLGQEKDYVNDNLDIENKQPNESIFQTDEMNVNPETELETNLGLTEDKPKTNLGPTRDKHKTNQGRTQDKPKTELETKPKTKEIREKANARREDLRHTWDKLETNAIIQRITSLSDLQKSILIFIYKECQSVLDIMTTELTFSYVVDKCNLENTGVFAIRKALQRMEDRGIFSRPRFKDGRHGWTRYELHKRIYETINILETNNNLETILRQPKKKLETEPRTEPKTNLHSNSSLLDKNNKKTTTGSLSEEWQKIDNEPLKQYGFNSNHILDIFNKGKSIPENVQESIYQYAWARENGKTKYSLDQFVGGLVNGRIWTFEGYESPQDKSLRELVEQKKTAKAKRESLINDLFDADFPDWRKKLTDEEIKSIVSSASWNMKHATAREVELREHFKNKILIPELESKNLIEQT